MKIKEIREGGERKRRGIFVFGSDGDLCDCCLLFIFSDWLLTCDHRRPYSEKEEEEGGGFLSLVIA